MTPIETLEYQRLTTDVSVNAIVGETVYSQLLDQDKPPPAIVMFIKEKPEYVQEGESGSTFVEAEFHCWASDPQVAKTLGLAVRECIDSVETSMTVGPMKITIFTSEETTVDDQGFNSDLRLFKVAVSGQYWSEVGNA